MNNSGSLRRLFVGHSRQLGYFLFAIALSILIGSVIIYINGDDPLVAYSALLAAGLGTPANIASTLAKATPLILTGLSAAIAFRSGVVNIGGEGQLYMGAMATALAGVYLQIGAAWAHVSLALLIGAAAGLIWAVPFQWLRNRFGTDELVTTILANYVAILFTTYLAAYPFMRPGAPLAMTANVMESAELPRLLARGRLNVGFLIAVALCILLWAVLFHSSVGFELRTIGSNRRFARYIGISVSRRYLLAMALSGALAGLAGAIEVLGVQHRFIQDISPGYGFDGILIALMAFNNPLGVFFVALLFGLLKAGGLGMEAATNVPSELSQVLQSIIILLVSAQFGVSALTRWLERRRDNTAASIAGEQLPAASMIPLED